MQRNFLLLFVLSLVALLACASPSSAPLDVPQKQDSTVVDAAEVVTTLAPVMLLSSANIEHGLVGSFENTSTASTLTFDIQQERETGIVHGTWTDSLGNTITVTLTDPRGAEMTINGLSVNEGMGSDDSAVQQLLEVYNGPTGDLLLGYVLELGCQDTEESEQPGTCNQGLAGRPH